MKIYVKKKFIFICTSYKCDLFYRQNEELKKKMELIHVELLYLYIVTWDVTQATNEKKNLRKEIISSTFNKKKHLYAHSTQFNSNIQNFSSN